MAGSCAVSCTTTPASSQHLLVRTYSSENANVAKKTSRCPCLCQGGRTKYSIKNTMLHQIATQNCGTVHRESHQKSLLLKTGHAGQNNCDSRLQLLTAPPTHSPNAIAAVFLPAMSHLQPGSRAGSTKQNSPTAARSYRFARMMHSRRNENKPDVIAADANFPLQGHPRSVAQAYWASTQVRGAAHHSTGVYYPNPTRACQEAGIHPAMHTADQQSTGVVHCHAILSLSPAEYPYPPP